MPISRWLIWSRLIAASVAFFGVSSAPSLNSKRPDLRALLLLRAEMIAGVELFHERHSRVLVIAVGREIVRPEAERALRRRSRRGGRHAKQKRYGDLFIEVPGPGLLGEVEAQQIARIGVLILIRGIGWLKPVPHIDARS